VISRTEISLADALSHGETYGYRLTFKCENCGGDLFQIIEANEKKGNRHEDVIIERSYYLKCQYCGSEEADRVMTIVPSWSAPLIDRDSLPEWGKL
jgi:YgiT-type zinc finger domain-containing protein